MASYVFPSFGQFPGFSGCRASQQSRTPGLLDHAVVSVLSRAVSSKPKVVEDSLAFAALCNVTWSQTIAGLRFSSEPAPNEFESTSTSKAKGGLWSIVIPTYNRLPILKKCLEALEEQEGYECSGIREYEVVVVDDGSTDGTWEHLLQFDYGTPSGEKLPAPVSVDASVESSPVFPHVKVIRQEHGGATRARNLGVRQARGAVIVFIDSDLVVAKDFLREHGAALSQARTKHGDDSTFTYGRVVNTSNFENPKSEKFKLTDNSAAFFATGNVALSRRLLLKAGNLLTPGSEGPFDVDFSEYGWEDLELGVRLKQVGARIQHVPSAVGYHWHPPFSMEQIPKLIDQERQRGRNGVRFFLKHPSLDVRLMTQLTPFHEAVWLLLTLGGLLNERTLSPVLAALVEGGHPGLAAGVLSPTLNWHTVRASKDEVVRLKQQGKFVRRELT